MIKDKRGGLIALTILGAIFVIGVNATTHNDADAQPATLPGSPTVYAKINATTDCNELFAMYETSEQNHIRVRQDWQREYTQAYMDAADKRLHEVGCYG